MKKRMNLSTQLIAVFSLVLILSAIIFSLSLTIGLNNFFETENMNRLTLYLSSLPSDMKNYSVNDDSQYSDIGIVTVIDNKYSLNNAAKKYILLDEAKEIITSNSLSILPISGEAQTEKGTIYYSVKINSSDQVVMVITNSKYLSTLRTKTYVPISIAFVISLILGNAVVLIWSRKIVSGLQYIENDLLKEKEYQKIEENKLVGQEMLELALSIVDMQKTIDENEHTKQEMLQNIGHDFKTPIAVIRSYAEAILDKVEDPEAASVIIKEADVLKNKVAQLLEITKLEYIQNQKDFEEIPMKNIILSVVENYKHQTNLEFILDLQEVSFLGFNENYFSVIDNLVSNAIRYAKTYVRIILQEDEIWVENDGEPIDSEFIDKIFTPYEKGVKGEFGLGMAIVYRTLSLFQYKIEVHNTDYGVSFHIYK